MTRQKGAATLTVDFATAASQNGMCLLNRCGIYVMILFHDCNMIKDDSNKKHIFLLFSEYYWFAYERKAFEYKKFDL
jgi:hypothetical protein